MIPHGDRRDGAESCGVEDEVIAAVQREHDVMSVLILRHDLRDLTGRRRAAGPAQDVGQGEKRRELGGQLAEELRWHATDRRHWHFAHVETYEVQGATVSAPA
jgi:hypothetical protein